ncbi:unnamed protein product [Auanema sp. JU1783]|nr:unnamed protein product [Auanema sp. JU1783]
MENVAGEEHDDVIDSAVTASEEYKDLLSFAVKQVSQEIVPDLEHTNLKEHSTPPSTPIEVSESHTPVNESSKNEEEVITHVEESTDNVVNNSEAVIDSPNPEAKPEPNVECNIALCEGVGVEGSNVSDHIQYEAENNLELLDLNTNIEASINNEESQNAADADVNSNDSTDEYAKKVLHDFSNSQEDTVIESSAFQQLLEESQSAVSNLDLVEKQSNVANAETDLMIANPSSEIHEDCIEPDIHEEEKSENDQEISQKNEIIVEERSVPDFEEEPIQISQDVEITAKDSTEKTDENATVWPETACEKIEEPEKIQTAEKEESPANFSVQAEELKPEDTLGSVLTTMSEAKKAFLEGAEQQFKGFVGEPKSDQIYEEKKAVVPTVELGAGFVDETDVLQSSKVENPNDIKVNEETGSESKGEKLEQPKNESSSKRRCAIL